MARNVNVATISYGNSPKELSRGLDALLGIWEQLVDLAALDAPDLILLPEHFATTGFSAPLAEIAEDPAGAGGPQTAFLRRKARQHRAWIFASYPRRAEIPGGFYNSAVLVNREGTIAGIYDKTFPTIGEMEQKRILPGAGARVFETDFGRIGAGICFDFNFRELFAEYRRLGTDLFCFLSAFPAGFQIPVAAYEYQMHMASAICLPKGMIVNPLGRVLAAANGHAPVIQARLNLDCRVLHIDFNRLPGAVPALKERYRREVRVEVAGDEAVYLVTSEHPRVSVADMIREFSLEPLDDYLNRVRAARTRERAAIQAARPA